VRLHVVVASVTGLVAVAFYNVVAVIEGSTAVDLAYADFFLGSMVVMGMSVSYLVERSSRLLFLRERDLAEEKERSEALLRNTLPDAIVERLKDDPGTIADANPAVTVLFADMVDFTSHAARMEPRDLVHALDDVFRRFDALADRFGLEKIKTVGDAYMAVAGTPEPRPDHAAAAAEMALAIVEVLEETRWPTGEPLRARVGLASGPVVAGVIGERKFAFDLWGDTVNLASRLESHGVPGKIQVSRATYELLRDRYAFEPAHVVDLKGKGPTEARFLLGPRTGTRAAADPAAVAGEAPEPG
jgi:class 3 adenylate cyclase